MDERANALTATHFIETLALYKEWLPASEFYEVRTGAASIMDFQARNKKVDKEVKRQLFELYLHRHGGLNNWDLWIGQHHQ